jgi:hypothetical protein
MKKNENTSSAAEALSTFFSTGKPKSLSFLFFCLFFLCQRNILSPRDLERGEERKGKGLIYLFFNVPESLSKRQRTKVVFFAKVKQFEEKKTE